MGLAGAQFARDPNHVSELEDRGEAGADRFGLCRRRRRRQLNAHSEAASESELTLFQPASRARSAPFGYALVLTVT